MNHKQSKTVSNDSIIESYSRTGNIWRTGNELGIAGQTVHRRLSELGLIKHMNYWTQSDNEILLSNYLNFKKENKLDVLAKSLGRTKQFICRKAKSLGLTNRSFPKSQETKNKIGANTKKWIKEHGHPRGFLNHTHSEESLKKMSDASRKNWSDPNCLLNSAENRQRLSDQLHFRRITGLIDVYSNRGNHKCFIGGKEYVFKSSWEKEVAFLLQSLITKGLIRKWGYEQKHFIFKDVKMGIRSYCPDFEVTFLNGDIIYIEVKGWKMEKSMKRIEMFRERYQTVKFLLLDENEYKRAISESDYLWRRCIEIQSVSNN